MPSDQLKIMVFAESLSPASETFVYHHIHELSKQYTLWPLCLRRENEAQFKYDRVKVLPHRRNRWVRWRRRFNARYRQQLSYHDPLLARVLQTKISECTPDIIHCHFGIQALWIIDNLKTNIPVLITFHGYDASTLLRDPAYLMKMQQVLALPNVYCHFVADALLQNMINAGIQPRHAKIIHLGIDTRQFQPHQRDKQSVFTFLQIARFVEKKGHALTLRAYHRFLQSNPAQSTRLILAGDGPEREKMQQLAKTLGIKQHVEFPGWVQPSEAIDLMQQADVFVQHSITSARGDTEGLPTTLMEAMAMELPIISTQHSGIPELVKPEHGLLVAERDITAFSQCFSKMLGQSRRSVNRQHILAEFDLRVYLKRLVNYYQQIIQTPVNEG